MVKRLQSALGNLGYFFFWIVFVILVTFTVFQLHPTLIAISITIIENPALRPVGWSMDTTYGLSRVFWLVLGILWLGWVMFTEGYLREGKNNQQLLKRSFILLLIIGVVYAISYLTLLLLP